jgi:hypothetical protein
VSACQSVEEVDEVGIRFGSQCGSALLEICLFGKM